MPKSSSQVVLFRFLNSNLRFWNGNFNPSGWQSVNLLCKVAKKIWDLKLIQNAIFVWSFVVVLFKKEGEETTLQFYSFGRSKSLRCTTCCMRKENKLKENLHLLCFLNQEDSRIFQPIKFKKLSSFVRNCFMIMKSERNKDYEIRSGETEIRGWNEKNSSYIKCINLCIVPRINE